MIRTIILFAITILWMEPTWGQQKIVDMSEPSLSSEAAVFEGMVTKVKESYTDSVRIYVFDLIGKEGFTMYSKLDSAGRFRFEIMSGSTNAVSFLHGKSYEGYLLVEPGETTSLTLNEKTKDPVLRWSFGGAHSEWNNGMNRLPMDLRYNSLYNDVIRQWKSYTEDEDEFRFKEEVVHRQAELERKIKEADVNDEVKTFNYLASKLYFMELLSGYAMTLNEKYLQRGMDRSVSRDFYREAVKGDFLRFNTLLYTPMGNRLKQYATICNEQRGAHFTYPKFLDRIDYAHKGMLYLSDNRLLNDRQLRAIGERTPELINLIEKRNEALREHNREQLRNPMYHIRYIDDDIHGKDIYHAIVDQFEGRIVVMDFWATWCMPCRMAMENMKPLKEAYKDKVTFVYVTGETSSEETWRQLIPDIKGEHFYITDRQWNDLCKHIKVKSIPSYLVIDWDGLITKQFSGFPGNESLEKEIEKRLKEKEEKEKLEKEKEEKEKEEKEKVEKENLEKEKKMKDEESLSE